MNNKNFIPLKNLEVYSLSREISKMAWIIYSRMKWEEKKIIGQQFIASVDSIGANIAEGYGRFHYLDKMKFYYNARGSYNEAIEHWLDLLFERKLKSEAELHEISGIGNNLQIKLNNLISSTYKAKLENEKRL